MWANVNKWLQYRLNRLIARGTLFPYVLLAMLALLAVAIGMSAWFVGLYSPAALTAEGIEGRLGQGFFDTLFWSLKHVIDPGAFGEDYGAPLPVILIALFISILGLGIFGTLIAFISNSIQQRLGAVRRGNTPVMERGHTVILGWSNKIPFILDYLSTLGERLTVAVLAPHGIEEMETALRLRNHAHRDVDVVLRSGLTSSPQDLARMAIDRAAAVIALSPPAREAGSSHPDVETIKTLMLLKGYDGWHGARPGMAVEIDERRNVEVASIAGGRDIAIVSGSEIISKLLVQSARQRGISTVYAEVFASAGNAVRVHDVPEAKSATFGRIAHWFPHAIPLGVAWREGQGAAARHSAALNPEPDYEVAEDEQLILVRANDRPACDTRRVGPAAPARDASSPASPRLETLSILGWNDHIDEILAELDKHLERGARVQLATSHAGEYVRDHLSNTVPNGFRNLDINCVRGDLVDRASLERARVLDADCVIVLADNSAGDEAADSRSILTLLLLTDIHRSHGDPDAPHVVSELLDANNRDLLADTLVTDIVVSPEIISLQLTQIARNPVLGLIYRELLSAGGIEIVLRPIERYAEPGGRCSFDTLVAAAQRYSEIALGVQTASETTLNPPKDAIWAFETGDQVIVMAQQVYA